MISNCQLGIGDLAIKYYHNFDYLLTFVRSLIFCINQKLKLLVLVNPNFFLLIFQKLFSHDLLLEFTVKVT